MVVTLQAGERLHYLAWTASQQSRPIVLVHELNRTAWSWLPVAHRLAPGYPVIAPDLRGHGASDAPLTGYELESLALDVLTVMAGQGWGEPVAGASAVVAGHGMGAMVAVEMARLQPGSVAGLALVDGGWESMLEATRMLPMQLVEAMAEPPEVLASMTAWLADRRAFDIASWDTDQETAARSQVVETHSGRVAPVTKGSITRRLVEAMYAYRPLAALTNVRCPVSLLVADAAAADDEDQRERLLAIEDVQRARAAAGLPLARVRRFPGAGHDLMRHRPTAVAEDLVELAAT